MDIRLYGYRAAILFYGFIALLRISSSTAWATCDLLVISSCFREVQIVAQTFCCCFVFRSPVGILSAWKVGRFTTQHWRSSMQRTKNSAVRYIAALLRVELSGFYLQIWCQYLASVFVSNNRTEWKKNLHFIHSTGRNADKSKTQQHLILKVQQTQYGEEVILQKSAEGELTIVRCSW